MLCGWGGNCRPVEPTTGWMTYGHLQADCLYTGISSGPNARYRVWEAFTFFYLFTVPVLGFIQISLKIVLYTTDTLKMMVIFIALVLSCSLFRHLIRESLVCWWPFFAVENIKKMTDTWKQKHIFTRYYEGVKVRSILLGRSQYTGATWRIPVNRPRAASMRFIVKLLWPLVELATVSSVNYLVSCCRCWITWALLLLWSAWHKKTFSQKRVIRTLWYLHSTVWMWQAKPLA